MIRKLLAGLLALSIGFTPVQADQSDLLRVNGHWSISHYNYGIVSDDYVNPWVYESVEDLQLNAQMYGYRMLGGADDFLLFRADLQTTVVPERARGDDTATFTRATTATILDFEGLVKPVLSGEWRSKGARRVENLITASEDMTNGAYADANGAVSTAKQTTFDGTANGEVSQIVTIIDDGSGAGNRTFVYAVDIKLVSGTPSSDGALQVFIAGDAMTAVSVSIGSDVSSVAQRFAVTASTDVAGTQVRPIVRWDDAGVLEITKWKVEEVTGQAITTPSEYVSTGILSSPFHGVMVDGISLYDYANAITVTSNIVDESANPGALFDATDFYNDASGPFGYRAELGTTNLILQSEDLETTWSKSATTAAGNTNVAVAPDGKTTADRLIDDSSTGTGNVFARQNVTISSATDTVYSHFVKKDQLDWVALQTASFDAAANGFSYFDLTNGIVGTKSANHSSSGIEALKDDWYRCWVVFQSTADLAGLTGAVVADGDSDITVDLDGTSSIFAWGAQVEAGTVPSSYKKSEGTQGVRAADVLTYDDVGNILDAAGTAFAEVSSDWAVAPAMSVIIGRDTNGRIIDSPSSAPDTQVASFDGTDTTLSPAGTNFQNSPQKVASNWKAGGNKSAYAPGSLEPDVTKPDYDGTMGTGDLGIACLNTGANQFGGTVRFANVWGRQHSDAQVSALP